MTDITTVGPGSSVGSNAPGLPPINLPTPAEPPPRQPLRIEVTAKRPELVPVDHDPFAEPPEAKLVPVDHDPFAEPTMMDMAADIGWSIPTGLVKGAIGLAGFPSDAASLVNRGIDWAESKIGVKPERKLSDLVAEKQPEPPAFGSADIRRRLEQATGRQLYEPKTPAGKVTQTAAEFIPGAIIGGIPGMARRALVGGAAGAGSEVAGQISQGTPLEPWMRLGAALGIGGATAMMSQPRTAQRFIRAQMPDYVNDQAVTHADNLIHDAAQRGVTLTWPEALSQVTGRPVLSDMQRVLEGAKQTRARMQETIGDRPAQMRAAAEAEIANIAPPTAQPSTIGPAAGRAAEETLNAGRQVINRASEPFYDRAKTFRLSAAEMAPVRAHPGWPAAARAVRKDPQLNREVAHLPDDSIGFLNEVKKWLDQAAENAASPVQQGRSVQRAAGFRRDAQAVRDAAINAEAAAGQANYAQALNIQETARRRYLEPLLQGPLGKLANDNITTKKAIEALFPAEPLGGSEHEVSTAVGALSRNNPGVARQLVRAHVEAKLNEAFDAAGRSQEAAGFAGAGFAQRLTGSPVASTQRGENFRAAIEALPNGRQLWPGIERFLDIARATGTRQPIGSKTAFNEAELHAMATGKSIANLAKTAASPGEWWHAAHDMWGKWQMGNNLTELASIITDPRSEAVFRRLANSPRATREAINMAARLTMGIGLGSKTAAEDRAKRRK